MAHSVSPEHEKFSFSQLDLSSISPQDEELSQIPADVAAILWADATQESIFASDKGLDDDGFDDDTIDTDVLAAFMAEPAHDPMLGIDPWPRWVTTYRHLPMEVPALWAFTEGLRSLGCTKEEVVRFLIRHARPTWERHFSGAELCSWVAREYDLMKEGAAIAEQEWNALMADFGHMIVSDETASRPPRRKRLHPYWSDEAPPPSEPNWLLEGFFERGNQGVWVGAPGTFKTGTLLWLAKCVATETSWLRFPVPPGNGGNVLYLALEGQHGISRRIALIEQEHGLNRSGPHRLLIWPVAVNLTSSTDVDTLIAGIRSMAGQEITFALMVIDTLGRASGGEDLNDASTINRMWPLLERLQDAFGSPAFIVAHHPPKPPLDGKVRETGAGSQFLENNPDFTTFVVRDPDDPNAIIVKLKKPPRDFPSWAPLHLLKKDGLRLPTDSPNMPDGFAMLEHPQPASGQAGSTGPKNAGRKMKPETTAALQAITTALASGPLRHGDLVEVVGKELGLDKPAAKARAQAALDVGQRKGLVRGPDNGAYTLTRPSPDPVR